MPVQFWFDPACPFCWMTSRWLVRVAAHRDLDIEWLPISLLRKNGTREGEPFFAEVSASHGMLRVVEAVREAALRQGLLDGLGDGAIDQRPAVHREARGLVQHQHVFVRVGHGHAQSQRPLRELLVELDCVPGPEPGGPLAPHPVDGDGADGAEPAGLLL